MASSWAIPTTYTLLDGSKKSGFKAAPDKIPERAIDSGRWIECVDAYYHYNLFWFRNSAGDQMQALVAGTLEPVSGGRRLPAGFLDIYGPEPGPNSVKRVWLQAAKTFADDMLPFGFTRADATLVSERVEPLGLPGARFFRKTSVYWNSSTNDRVSVVENRVLFLHEGTMSNSRYVDFPSYRATDKNLLDDLAAAWQAELAYNDHGSLPPHAFLSNLLNDEERSLLENARR